VRLKRQLSTRTDVYLASDTDDIGIRRHDDLIRLSRAEWRGFVGFFEDAEALIAAQKEPQCGAIRGDGAGCVELPGHLDAGLDHQWVGDRDDINILRPELPAPEREDR
jgi:hypothetical protein